MSIFGWSYPPGCSGTPYDEPEAIDLGEDKTIKGYGKRGHGLNGKDADLGPEGQIVVHGAYWLDDGSIHLDCTRYATVGADPDWTDEQLDLATECVCGSHLPGEWDGDGWFLGESFNLKIDFPWPDDATEDEAISKACEAAVAAIEKDSEDFQKEISMLHEMIDQIAYGEMP